MPYAARVYPTTQYVHVLWSPTYDNYPKNCLAYAVPE